MKKMIKKTVRKGFSLLELAMVLAVGALILAGVMMYYNTVTVNQKTEDAIGELASIQQAVRNLGSGISGYTWVTSSIISQSGELPRKWIQGTASTGSANITNPFGGSVTVAQGATEETFRVTYNNVPNQACTKMGVMDLGSGVYQVSVAGTAVQGRALTPEQATAACGSSTNNSNILFWDFF